MKLSENLKKIRKDNNLSQEQLAEKLGVSRQAVSKWESNQSYPEMDKVLLICKMFNYNIDTLMNNNVVDVKEEEQAKNNLNKFVEDFFKFVTKTTNMFYNMKFTQIVKCLFEQAVNAIILLIISIILGGIGDMIFSGIFAFLPPKGYFILESFVSAVYIAFATVVSVIVFLHIFKIRYLDYYEFIEEKEVETLSKDKKLNNSNKDEKLLIEKIEPINSKKEKIIIRDPNHNPFGFLEIITKFVILGLKGMVLLFIILPASIALIGEVASIILFFMIAKSGLLFVGLELGSISAIIFTLLVLILSFNFLINKKVRLKLIGITFLIACVVCGTAIAFGTLGMTKFERTTETLTNDIETSEKFIMTDKLGLALKEKQINYIEKQDADNTVEVVVKHPEKYSINLFITSNKIKLSYYNAEPESFENIEKLIKMINDRQIIKYNSEYQIDVYATQDSINKLKLNYTKINHNN